MALPSPQRDALELVARRAKLWPADKVAGLTSRTTFKLASGKIVHFLGVSEGASMRSNPNLNIAVFGFSRPTGRPRQKKKLAQCQLGGLITSLRHGGGAFVEGLKFQCTRGKVAILRRVGERLWYRDII